MNVITDEKLNRLSAAVLADAHKKRVELEKENIILIEAKTEAAKTEFLEDAFEKIQDAIAEIRRDDNEKVLIAQAMARKEILNIREDIIDNVFKQINERLAEFKASEEYPLWLEKVVKKASAEVLEGEKLLYVYSQDKALAEDIIKNTASNDITKIGIINDEKGDVLSGGIMLKNIDKGIMADYTLKELIAEKKGGFLNRSGLGIVSERSEL